MGRTEKSQGLAPPAVRKDIRAKQARHIVNRVIPAILASNARARKGADSSELIVDPAPAVVAYSKALQGQSRDGGEDAQYVKRKGQGRRKAKNAKSGDDDIIVRVGHEVEGKEMAIHKKNRVSLENQLSQLSINSNPPQAQSKPKRSIRIIATDTITAAHMITGTSKSSRKQPNVCVLNMASPLRPGGGVLSGATSQEEFLCARTTLLPSLNESFYRLPEFGGIYTPDVLAFRSALPLGDPEGELGPGERRWIDVITSGMLRFPELEGAEGEERKLSKADRNVVEKKMRAVLRIASAKGIKGLVLGAWGCGAYGNPVREIAEAWRKVLDGRVSGGSKKSKIAEPMEMWDSIEQVTFAIANVKMAHDFAKAFGGGIEVESVPGSQVENEDEETDAVAEELRSKIEEMESQISQVWNPELKMRMDVILDGLRAQLHERQGDLAQGSEDDGEEEVEDTDTDSEGFAGEEEGNEEGKVDGESEEEEGSDEAQSQDGGLVL